MSWNKNTILNNTVDAMIELLTEVGVSYVVSTTDEVTDLGLNSYGEDAKIPLRLLVYKNKAEEVVFIQEYMARTHDCDYDDVVITKRSLTPPAPGAKLEFFTDCDENHPESLPCKLPV
jgi:hypothetical protein